jgi:hypothetical protein
MFDLDLSPPPELNVSLWRSLLINLADRFAPERLPPLQLTSKPVDVGILDGDLLSLPWYRTVFSNIGDVISPELLPPLELTSQPVDVGELLGDELDHGWWDSLLQNLRDRLSPQKQLPLQLTSQPVTAFGAESSLQILDWSSLISGPKIFHPDEPQPQYAVAAYQQEPVPATAMVEQEHPGLLAARMQLTRDIGKTRFRRKIWIGLAAAEAVFLLVAMFKFT